MRHHTYTSAETYRYFYPRTPNGVRQNVGKRFGEMTPISIHALQTECDPKRAEPMETIIISIHALQTECDALAAGMDLKRVNFYPRTPNGVRLTPFRISVFGIEFLSTHSKRSATWVYPMLM